MKANGRELFKRCLRKLFELGQHLGLNILPLHFYSGIPDMRELRRTDYWKNPRAWSGLTVLIRKANLPSFVNVAAMSLIAQQETLRIYERCSLENGKPGYGKIEADFLFCFIRSKKPGKIIQIGPAFQPPSSFWRRKEAGYTPEVVCIDPFSNEFLRRAHERRQIELIPKRPRWSNWTC